jgi:hypothetical protein
VDRIYQLFRLRRRLYRLVNNTPLALEMNEVWSGEDVVLNGKIILNSSLLHVLPNAFESLFALGTA